MTSTLPDPEPSMAGAIRPTVFIDAAVLTVDEPAPDRRHEPRRIVAPGAAEALALLGESHEVVVVGHPGDDAPELATLQVVDGISGGFPPAAWYITGDEAWCEGDRPTGLHSILVGPKRPPARRPTLRCDMEARDLNAAVMEILVRESMA